MKNISASIYIDLQRTHGEISPLLFGGFIEHMGRAIYGGIYEPRSLQADERGLRRDVLAALRDLGPTVTRYPGGNFLSGYDWRDGVGPRAERPRRREPAWQSIETNQFGTNEFVEFCRIIETQPMLGVNLGTGAIDEAANLVEYCNAPRGTQLADLRAAHGCPEPHRIKYWCLGNEMDGPWQIGHLEAVAYARKAREAAKMMKWQDPAIHLVACGSSSSSMPTYPEWDRIVLETCWDQVDSLSLHYYADNRDNDTASFLALAAQFENQLDTLAATLRYVKAKLRSTHEVHLSWDEWNVWYKDKTMQGHWTEAPHLIEEVYNLEDALVVAQWLSVFLRRCDVLKIACLAQLVNVIAPLLTRPDSLLRQTIFYPFMLFRQFASGASLDVLTHAPRYATAKFGDMPVLDVSASYDAAQASSAVFIVNRSQSEAVPTHIIWQGAAPAQIEAIYQIAGNDPKAANTFEHPQTIQPIKLSGGAVVDNSLMLNLPPLSFTVLVSGHTVKE
jgi:alpha-N-arabinofuranosidase